MERNAVTMATAGAATKSQLVGPLGDHLFLEEELDAVGDRLQEAEGPVRLGPRRNCMNASSRRSM